MIDNRQAYKTTNMTTTTCHRSFDPGHKNITLYYIVAVIWGIHVSPAKYSYAWLLQNCYYRTDRRQTKWSLCAAMLRKGQNITTQSVASPRTPHLSMIPIMTFTFELRPPKSIGFTMVNMSAKFDEEAPNGLDCIRFTAYFHTCPLWPWPLTSKIKRAHHLTMVNIFAKFEEIHNGLVSIVFSTLSPYMSIVTLTFDLHHQ